MFNKYFLRTFIRAFLALAISAVFMGFSLEDYPAIGPVPLMEVRKLKKDRDVEHFLNILASKGLTTVEGIPHLEYTNQKYKLYFLLEHDKKKRKLNLKEINSGKYPTSIVIEFITDKSGLELEELINSLKYDDRFKYERSANEQSIEFYEFAHDITLTFKFEEERVLLEIY